MFINDRSVLLWHQHDCSFWLNLKSLEQEASMENVQDESNQINEMSLQIPFKQVKPEVRSLVNNGE